MVLVLWCERLKKGAGAYSCSSRAECSPGAVAAGRVGGTATVSAPRGRGQPEASPHNADNVHPGRARPAALTLAPWRGCRAGWRRAGVYSDDPSVPHMSAVKKERHCAGRDVDKQQLAST